MTADLIVTLPSTCRCGCLKGRIAAGHAICLDCGTKRLPVSEKTTRFLAQVAGIWGAPDEVVLRRPDAAEKIEQQDLYLKTHHVRDGRSFHQVITDVFDRIEDGGETPNDSGEETVDGPTIGEQDSADSQ
jgi:hypothetical protein